MKASLEAIAFVAAHAGPLVLVAGAQTPLHELHGAHAVAYFGGSACGLGDVDGDGRSDFAVAAIREDTFGTDTGVVRVFSGATGALLATLHGAVSDTFGSSLVDAGDVDGDSKHDLLVGAPRVVGPNNYGPGYVQLISTASWLSIHTFAAPPGQHQYGYSVAGRVDVDADGTPDVIIGDYAASNFVGAVDVFSGASGAPLLHIPAPTNEQGAFGESVAGVSDVDGDGGAEILVGAPSAGVAHLYSGASGLLLRSYPGVAYHYANPVANAGDLDGDGVDDHAIAGISAGNVDLFSGASGALIRTLQSAPSNGYPLTIANLGDVDADLIPDLIVGSSNDSIAGTAAGSARIYSGASGALITSVFGAPGENLGGGSAAGDVDADGRPDFLVHLNGIDSGAGYNAGLARVVSLQPPPVSSYCTAKVNSLGCIPFIGFSGGPSMSSALPFVVRAYKTVNNKPGLLLYGFSPASTPFQGGRLCIQPPIRRTPPSSSNGTPTGDSCTGGYSFDFGNLIQSGSNPALQLGTSVFCQFWMRDPGASFGSGLTNAETFTIGV